MNIQFKERSLRTKILMGLILGNFAILTLYEVPSFLLTAHEMGKNFELHKQKVIARFQKTLDIPIWNYDGSTVKQIVEVEISNSSLVEVRVLKPGLPIVLEDLFFVGPLFKEATTHGWLFTILGIEALQTERFSISHAEEVIADVEVTFAFPNLILEWNRLSGRILLEMFMFIVLVGIMLTILLERLIHRPLGKILGKLEFMSLGQFDTELPITSSDEMGILGKRILSMEDELKHLYQRLYNQNQELKIQVEERTASLIESEKRASISRLVAGIAHELNTPIGITLTMVTHGLDKLGKLEKSLKEGALTKAAMDEYIEVTKETYQLSVQNITHAVELIQSFKRVSVDHFTEELLGYNLKQHIDKIIPSVAKLLASNKIEILVSGDEDISLYSYPNGLTQIILNLIMNTTMHAYDPLDPQPRKIWISIQKDTQGLIHLRFGNNGKPIPPEVLPHVWEAFFTTNRAAGGTGLGLYIIKGIVEQQLKGTIQIVRPLLQEEIYLNTVSQGLIFEIIIPDLTGFQDGLGAKTIGVDSVS